MTDPISNYSRIALGDSDLRSSQKKAEATASAGTSPAKPTAEAPQRAELLDDELQLSDMALQAMRTDTFDRTKVEAIKEAIQNGQYPLDSRRIAENFYAIEQMIKG